MLSPFEVHSQLNSQYQEILGGTPGNRRLQANLNIIGTIVPCTITPILANFEIEAGRSSLNFVEECEFLVADCPNDPQNPNNKLNLQKAINVVLTVSSDPKAFPMQLPMQLWLGGLLPGGLIWRFSLADQSYKG
jgi:hypothetical protein